MTTQRGRKKNHRCVSFHTETLACPCFGPLTIPIAELQAKTQTTLSKEEMQVLVDKDLCGLTMDIGAANMGISKTVYAGIYKRARKKIINAIVESQILHIECDKKPQS